MILPYFSKIAAVIFVLIGIFAMYKNFKKKQKKSNSKQKKIDKY